MGPQPQPQPAPPQAPPAQELAKLIAAALTKEGLLAGEADKFEELLARGDISAEGWKAHIKVVIPKVGTS